VEAALDSPLLNDNNIEGARYILLNITSGNTEVTMDEMGEITDYIQDKAGQTAEVIMGVGNDETLGDKIGVTLIATGFKSKQQISSENIKQPEKIVYDLNAPAPDYDNANRTSNKTKPNEPSIRTVEETLPVTSVHNFNRIKDDSNKHENNFSFQAIEKIILPKAKEIVESPFDNKEDFLKNITQPVTEEVSFKTDAQLEDVAIAPMVNEIAAELPESKVEEMIIEPVAIVEEVKAEVVNITPIETPVTVIETPVAALPKDEVVVVAETPVAIAEETPLIIAEVKVEEVAVNLVEEVIAPVMIVEIATPVVAIEEVTPVAEIIPVAVIEETPVAVAEVAIVNKVAEVVNEVIAEILPAPVAETIVEIKNEVVETKQEEIIAKGEELQTDAPIVFEFTDIQQPINSSSMLNETAEEQEEIVEEIKAAIEPEIKIVEKTPEPVMQVKSDEALPITSQPAVTENDIFKRTRERLEKLKQLSYRMSSPNTIADLEKEPAYKRRNVQLNDVKPSSAEGDISRVSLGTDENNKPTLNQNNTFLHDRVD
jgi:cell division protein FtsZ